VNEDATEVLEGGDDAAIETAARDMGWRPKDEFKGPEDKWVDAGEYLRRGQEVLPIVRADNRRLRDSLSAHEKELKELKDVVAENRASMAEFAEFHTELLQSRLKEQRIRLTAELRQARDEGDEGKIADLEDRIDENRQAARDAAAKAKTPTPASRHPDPTADPIFRAWADKSDWMNGTSASDLAKQGAAQRFGQEAARQGLTGQKFFDYIDAQIETTFGAPRSPTSKTEDGGRPAGGSAARGAFAALPADAQAHARAEAARFVGPNKMFKTEKEWFDHFAKQYA
jgi:hypothetical protein